MRNMTVDELRESLVSLPGHARVVIECEHDVDVTFAHLVTRVSEEQVEHRGMRDYVVVIEGGLYQLGDVWEDIE